ncbi:MAG: hypothetical protein EOP51_25055, partial [Sphingobacteriales bacterium]
GLRHYGPMAQEFYNAFGKDAHGTIGNDTTINQANMEGVMMIMIKALEERTAKQAGEIAILKTRNEELAALIQANKKMQEEWAVLMQELKKNDTGKPGIKNNPVKEDDIMAAK